ncbi:MAG: uroporphyrinogen-III synthase [Burkholderiales bacterium]|nr:uroporphyrinogen-III synthase [Burkholderiales bacterium]
MPSPVNVQSGDAPPPAPGPLAGVGVLVTRPERQAGGFVRSLAALDATVVVFPAIVILPPRDAATLARVRAALATYDIAIFVSANAAEYGVPAAGAWPAALRVLATGPGTAAALAAVGLAGAQVPTTTYDSEGLLLLPELVAVRDKRIVIFRGEGGRDHLARTLRERGAHVDYAECYRRAPPTSAAAGLVEALLAGRIHASTLTSREALDNLCNLLPAAARERLARAPAFVPHPAIAAHARELGFTAVTTAAGDAGLVAGLLEWFARHPAADIP